MALKLKTAPAVRPLTLAEVKAHCRVDSVDDDLQLDGLIDAAVTMLDGNSGAFGRCMIDQTWELYYDEFPHDDLHIPLGDVRQIESVEYVDATTGLYVVWNVSNYETDLISHPARIVPINGWPAHMTTTNATRVTFVAGFGASASDVPMAIRQAMLMLIGHWYENREATIAGVTAMPLPFAVEALLAPFRRVPV